LIVYCPDQSITKADILYTKCFTINLMTPKTSLKQLTRKLFSIVSFYSGYCALYEFSKLNYGARILCYHGISDNPTNHYAVSTSDFSKQIKFLADNFEVLTLDQLVARIQKNKPLHPKMIAVSFDDGYQDFYTHAFPILRKYRVSATVFLPVGSMDGDSRYRQILPQGEFLSWNQVRELQQNGVDFGSHGVSHTSLTKLTQQEIQYELEHSKARLEAEINKPIKGFAYPYGTLRDSSEKIGKLIADSGYSWAVTSVSGVIKNKSNPFALRRTVIMSDDGATGFRRALKGALDGWIIMQRGGYYLNKVISFRHSHG
jgi:peptidoglycan/xylan/chitin deacetylase (PgdA/CDA1 family)